MSFDLTGLALNYLIGVEDDTPILPPLAGTATVVPYGRALNFPISVLPCIAYGNLYVENKAEKDFFGPYKKLTDTAAEYGELVPDEKFPGFMANIRAQVEVRLRQGYQFMELDNADGYSAAAVAAAIDYCRLRRMGVIAKNAFITDDGVAYLANTNVFGCIVELNCGSPINYSIFRTQSQKINMPIWFVGYGDGADAQLLETAKQISRYHYRNMSVSWSPDGEYTSAHHVIHPNTWKIA